MTSLFIQDNLNIFMCKKSPYIIRDPYWIPNSLITCLLFDFNQGTPDVFYCRGVG